MNIEEGIMHRCIELAGEAYKAEEIPVAAIITDKQNQVLAEAFNTREKNEQIHEHAEINAINKIDYKNKKDLKLYTTLFPCLMCAQAIIDSGIKEVYYSIINDKSYDLVIKLFRDNNIRFFELYSKDYKELYLNFFKKLRDNVPRGTSQS